MSDSASASTSASGSYQRRDSVSSVVRQKSFRFQRPGSPTTLLFRIPFTLQVVLLLLVPALGLIPPSFYIAQLAKVDVAQRNGELLFSKKHNPLIETLNRFIHYTQRERGATVIFLASAGTQFVDEMIGFRATVDTELQTVRRFMEAHPIADLHLPEKGEKALQSALAQMDQLAAKRQLADTLLLTPAEAARFYSELNNDCITTSQSIVFEIENSQVAQRMNALLWLIAAKDHRGLLRSSGFETILLGGFTTEQQLMAFTEALMSEAVGIQLFKAFATEEHWQLYNASFSQLPAYAHIQTMQEVLTNFNDSTLYTEAVQQLNATAWFWNMTQILDAFLPIGEQMQTEIALFSRNAAGSGVGTWGSIAAIVFVVVVTGIAAVFMVKRASQASKDMAKEAEDRLANVRATTKFIPTAFLRMLGYAEISELQLGDCVNTSLAVLFSSVTGFAQLSTTMSSEQLFAWLVDYTTTVAPVIKKRKGFIDKLVGDSVMAVFFEPQNALRAAMEYQSVISMSNVKKRTKYGRSSVAIDAAIGVHYGKVCVGVIGDTNRTSITLVSDTVNVASRLEGVAKDFNAKIVASFDLLQKCSIDGIVQRYLGKITVKGRKASVSMHEIVQADTNATMVFKSDTTTDLQNALFHTSTQQECLDALQAIQHKANQALVQDGFVEYCIQKLQQHPEMQLADGRTLIHTSLPQFGFYSQHGAADVEETVEPQSPGVPPRGQKAGRHSQFPN